jgi:lauroyl/myristoyl acyltransferase
MRYHFFRFLVWLVPHLPRRALPLLATLGGNVAWLVAHKARKQATLNALHVLGPSMVGTHAGRRKLRQTVRGMFITTAHNYLEVCALPTTSNKEFMQRIDSTDFSALDEALARGKGVILVSAHLGPFDYVVQCAALYGYDITIPVEHLHDQRMLDLMLQLRRSHGVHFVPLGNPSAMRTLLQRLRENRIVLITADRAVQGQSTEYPFFGAKARLPIGPVELSLRTGAPLVAGFGWYTPKSHVRGLFVPLTLALPEEQRADQDALMQLLVKTLEQCIAAHPQQWSVFTPIWVE